MINESTANILLVDDVIQNIQIAANILRSEFPRLSLATSGEEALGIVAQGGIDLILLDVMMPNMDGFEVCRRLKQDDATSDIPVIFLTAKTSMASLVEGFETGAVDYIAKPFNASELMARVRTHVRLRQTDVGLRRFMAEKDRFLGIVAHQFDTPFGSLRGMLKLLQEQHKELPPEELEEYLDMAVQTSDMLAGLLENLLLWSKLHTGGFGYAPRQLSVRDLMEDVSRSVEGKAAAKGIRVELAIDPALSTRADLEMAERALEGLLSNAIKYSPSGGVVKVTAAGQGGKAQIEIEDQGIGIPSEQISGLFDPLRQVLRPGPMGETGGGLGLAVARALIERNGGILAIESAVGRGTTARVRLPLDQL